MNFNYNQTELNNECCADVCNKTFHVEEREIVNTYKCTKRKLSASEIWNIQKNKKEIFRRY